MVEDRVGKIERLVAFLLWPASCLTGVITGECLRALMLRINLAVGFGEQLFSPKRAG